MRPVKTPKLEPGFWTPNPGPVWVPDGSLGTGIPPVQLPADRVQLGGSWPAYGPNVQPDPEAPMPTADAAPETVTESNQSILDRIRSLGRRALVGLAPFVDNPVGKIFIMALPFGLLLLVLWWFLRKKK